jgi:hypothetical protein
MKADARRTRRSFDLSSSACIRVHLSSSAFNIFSRIRMRYWLPVCAVLLFIGGCTGTGKLTGQSTVQAQAMQGMLADVELIRGYVYGSGMPSDAESAARDLVAWSAKMAELFPPGQASTDYVDMSPRRAGGDEQSSRRAARSYAHR